MFSLHQKRFIPLLGIIFLSPKITPLHKQTKINHSISGSTARPLRVSLANLEEYNNLKYNQSIGVQVLIRFQTVHGLALSTND